MAKDIVEVENFLVLIDAIDSNTEAIQALTEAINTSFKYNDDNISKILVDILNGLNIY